MEIEEPLYADAEDIRGALQLLHLKGGLFSCGGPEKTNPKSGLLKMAHPLLHNSKPLPFILLGSFERRPAPPPPPKHPEAWTERMACLVSFRSFKPLNSPGSQMPRRVPGQQEQSMKIHFQVGEYMVSEKCAKVH